MKFGMESEKIIYDEKEKKVSNTAQRTLQALDDYKVIYGDEDVGRVTGEFVHNMIEMSSAPSEQVFDVVRDYLFSYELVKEVCDRTGKRLLPIGSYPLSFTPTMVSKWEYYVKNAILSGNADIGWNLERNHRLFPASNCAGVHIHAELETFPQYHAFSPELADKHNMAVALVPLSAFSSSPYAESISEAKSMRAFRYFFGVYGSFQQCGGIPPLFADSLSVLKHYLDGARVWEKRGIELGFDPEELHKLTQKTGANWGMVRWNHKWNTVEMRCFDTDLVGMDIAKFTLASRALKRMDLKGEHLHTRILLGENAVIPKQFEKQDQLLRELMPEILEVSGNEVALPPTPLMHRIIHLAVIEGLSNEIVYDYVGKLIRFASRELDWKEKWVANTLTEAYFRAESTSDWILKYVNRKKTLRKEDVEGLLHELLQRESEQFLRVSQTLPQELQIPTETEFPILRGKSLLARENTGKIQRPTRSRPSVNGASSANGRY